MSKKVAEITRMLIQNPKGARNFKDAADSNWLCLSGVFAYHHDVVVWKI
jgi:hypothetical protein